MSSSLVRVPTKDLYDRWARIYDQEENVLQSLDDEIFRTNLTTILSRIHGPMRVLDMGCGTGRNTYKLAHSLLPTGSQLFAVDASDGMLKVAKDRMSAPQPQISVHWVKSDIQALNLNPPVDLVVSTLVLEHMLVEDFFAAVRRNLNPGGWLYVTNMHEEMERARAGFLDQQSGVKFQGQSWNHCLEDVMNLAHNHGFKVEGSIQEYGPKDEEDVSRYGERSRKWLGRKMLLAVTFVLQP